MEYKDKSRVATAINDVNWKLRAKNANMMLMVPGKIGETNE